MFTVTYSLNIKDTYLLTGTSHKKEFWQFHKIVVTVFKVSYFVNGIAEGLNHRSPVN